MSVISNVHSVVDYDSKKSDAFTGQRLSKVLYKTDSTSGIKKQGKCVSIPPVTSEFLDVDNMNLLRPVIISYLQDCQDKMVRALVESGKTEIQDSDLSPVAIAAFMAEESTGSRLTKESIGSWFDSSISELLTVAFADKLGVSDTPSAEQMKQIENSIGQYREKIAVLAGGKTSYSCEVADRLLKVMEFADADDELASKFRVRLVKMKENTASMLLEL